MRVEDTQRCVSRSIDDNSPCATDDELNELLRTDWNLNHKMDARRWMLKMIDFGMVYPEDNDPLDDEFDINCYSHRDVQWIILHSYYKQVQGTLGSEFGEYITEFLNNEEH